MVCQLCKQDAPLVNSHIIPKSFYRGRRDNGNKPLKLISNIDNEYPRKSQSGIYDQIVCENCERLFSPWDDYAQALLLGRSSELIPLVINNETVAYRLENIDYHKLKLFFISLLWRASASSKPFFSKIRSEGFEILLNKAIRENEPGVQDFFSVNLAKFNPDIGTAILDPHRERFDGINYYRFYLADYVAYIKVDKRRTPINLRNLALSQDRHLIIISRDLQKSTELHLIKNLIRANNQT